MAELEKGHEGPAWAKGYSVEELKRMTSVFAEHDAGMIHGGFGRFSEVDLVGALEEGRIAWGPPAEDGRPLWALVARAMQRRQGVKDFTGSARLRLEPGMGHVSRVAWQGHTREEGWLAVAATLAGARRRLALELWQEHPGERLLADALELALAAVKIAASSEMRGVYVPRDLAPPPYPQHQAVGLARLERILSPAALSALVAQVEALDGGYAQHYSSYNKGGSWAALSLRGFYDDPARIEKPAEMNRKWKREHPADLELEPRDTPLREQLKAVEPILAALPCEQFERIRLMSLAPGGGELERHADITDADAGAEPGRLVRLHIPLVTNPEVVFRSWDLNGVPRSLVMRRGGVYFLDVRKPHTAVNGGESQRIHLVADAIATDETVAALAAAEEALPDHAQHGA
jgi:hypothetical protein